MISGKIADHDYPVITVEEWKQRNEERMKQAELDELNRILTKGTKLERKRLVDALNAEIAKKKKKSKKNKSA